MVTKEKFQIKPPERSSFDRRVAQATGLVALDQARREAARIEVLGKMRDKVGLLDTSREGNGAALVTALMLESLESSGEKPGIYVKPAESAETVRQKDDIAFGNNDMSDRNILRIVPGAKFGQKDMEEIQAVFKDGVTFLGDEDVLKTIPNEAYDNILGPNDAVVVLHQAKAELQPHPEASIQV